MINKLKDVDSYKLMNYNIYYKIFIKQKYIFSDGQDDIYRGGEDNKMLKNIKFKKYLAAALAVVAVAGSMEGVSQAEAAKPKKSKSVTIEMGSSYKLKHNKKYTYKSSKPKIAKVSKKGVIKANGVGKCTVKVMKNKTVVKKYSVTVTPNIVGGWILKSGYIVEGIEIKDASYSTVTLIHSDDLNKEDVQRIRFDILTSRLNEDGIVVGSNVRIGYNVFTVVEHVSGNVCVYEGDISIGNESKPDNADPSVTPLPTPIPQ